MTRYQLWRTVEGVKLRERGKKCVCGKCSVVFEFDAVTVEHARKFCDDALSLAEVLMDISRMEKAPVISETLQ